MKSLFRVSSLALCLGAASVTQLQAAYIQGTVNFSGVASLTGGDYLTATGISFSNPVDVDIADGDYAGLDLIPGAATFTDFTFGTPGTVGANAVSPLWSIADGLDTWTFELSSIYINSVVGTQRLLEGNGTLTGPAGFVPTPGFWTLSTSGTNTRVTFSAYSEAVPDGGTTLALLGLSLLGIHGIRRKFRSQG